MTDITLDRAPAPSRGLDPETPARLHSRLLSERSVQAAIVVEQEAAVRALSEQIDAYSVLERELAERRADRARAAIHEIDEALTRIEADT
jgi:hypothetical protein